LTAALILIYLTKQNRVRSFKVHTFEHLPEYDEKTELLKVIWLVPKQQVYIAELNKIF
jgi:hypothetical protein